MSDQATSAGIVEVFYSYSHKDERLRDRLHDHLAMLKRQGLITEWHDRKITAGADWAAQIDEHLDRAALILLLISASFLSSDYCYGIELKRAMEKHERGEAKVIAILLRPVDWEGSPFRKLQVLPPNARPVTKWKERDEAFAKVAAGIRAAIQEIVPQANLGLVATVPLAGAISRDIGLLPGVWNVPATRNPYFTGREAALQALRATFTSAERRPNVQVIRGGPGIGKTQLAIEYAYRYADKYRVVRWIRSDEPTSLAADLGGLAWALNLPERGSKDQSVLLESVRQWLRENQGWLLVFDKAPNPQQVLEALPLDATGHILITSPRTGAAEPGITLTGLSQDEAIEFLLKRTGQGDRASAAEIADRLEGLPLALEQSCAYMQAGNLSLSDYLGEFDRREIRVREARIVHADPPSDRPASQVTTWDLSILAVQEASPAAVELLDLCAYLAPDDIPLGLFTDQIDRVPESLRSVVTDPSSLEDALSILSGYGLLTVAGDSLFAHRELQGVARQRLPIGMQRKWAEAAIVLVESAFPVESQDVRSWPTCGRLLPHALTSTQHAEELAVAGRTIARLLRRTAGYLTGRAQFAEARSMIERALALDKETFGADHPEVAMDLVALGRIQRAMEDLPGARDSLERALAVHEAAYGPQHARVAVDLIKLGRLLRAMGNLPAAREKLERGVALAETIFGPDHTEVAVGLGNLGRLLQDMGQLPEARATLDRALAIDEAAYGHDHPEVGTDLVNIARVQRDMGDLADAKANLERAVAIQQAAYGPDHPEVGIALGNLGRVLDRMGDNIGARENLQRALAIFRERLGEEHSFTKTVKAELASLRT
ncbi:MAG TPA: toll/interleukin-1 receptor domain-containing protein [Actinomycetota bacterium]